MRELGPSLVGLGAIVGYGFAAGPSAAQQQPEPAMDAETLTGLGTALNFRGAGNEFDADVTFATATDRLSPVWTTRLSARAMLLPALGQASSSWGAWVGLRTAVFQYQRPEGSGDPSPDGIFPANVEPTIGIVAESVADEVRFEADVAPVIALAEASELTSQASIVAAMSTSPHDDLLFVPNVQGGARLRLALSRRFRWCDNAFFEVGTEIEAGYARAASTIGTTAGGTGGGKLYAKLYFRFTPRPAPYPVEGLAIEGFGDLGYTTIWPADVVVPMLIGGGLTLDVNRGVEARALFSFFSADPIQGGAGFGLGSIATTLGVRFTLGHEPAGWTQRQIDLQPDLGDDLARAAGQ